MFFLTNILIFLNLFYPQLSFPPDILLRFLIVASIRIHIGSTRGHFSINVVVFLIIERKPYGREAGKFIVIMVSIFFFFFCNSVNEFLNRKVLKLTQNINY